MNLPGVLGKAVAYVLAVLVSLRMGLGIYAWNAANRLERPGYETVARLPGGVELREYRPYVVAETEVKSGGMRETTGRGFRTVAAYLFGKNRPQGSSRMSLPKPASFGLAARAAQPKGEKMSMTAPVRSSTTGSDFQSTKISFVMPSKYSMRSAPRPVDRAVRLRQVDPHYLAARAFSGPPPGENRVQRERERLLRALGETSLLPASGDETLVLGYHDPFMTPNFLRRNEVGIYVDGASVRNAGLTTSA